MAEKPAPPQVRWAGRTQPAPPQRHASAPTVHRPSAAQAKPQAAPPPRPSASPPRPSAPPPPRPAATLQPMNPSGGLPANLAGYPTMSWKQHQNLVNQGYDQIGLRVWELNQGVTRADLSTALIIPTEDIAARGDTQHALLSIENLEAQSWKVTQRINKRVNQGLSTKSDMAKQTEVIGEAAAFNAMAKQYPNYELAFAVDPGHGGGIDQLWLKYNANGSVNTYFIVEAKGPRAKLNNSPFSIAQMSKGWVENRLKKLSGNADATVAGLAKAAHKAIKKKGNGGTVPYVDGAVYTARWDQTKHELKWSVSKKKRYN